MKELKRLNKFLLKYKGKLLLGLVSTIVSRVFSLVTPRLVGDSMTTIENYLNLIRKDLFATLLKQMRKFV